MHSILRRYPLPTLFIAVFCAVSGVYAYGLGPGQQRLVVANTATNLANLRNDPLGTMIASAFVAEAAPWMWVAFAIVGLFPVAHRFGNVRTLVLVGAAQVVGTLISEGLLAWRISTGAMPTSARYLDDVGPSYVIASALVATILYGAEPLMRTARHGHWLFDRVPSRWWRIGAAVGLAFLAPHLFNRLDRLDVAAVGHVVAMLVGAGVGLFFVHRERAHAGSGGAGPRTDVAPAPAFSEA
ncbi:rhomboid-like protein [Actinoallomurus sp. NPDC050550]|uniref:rhomboid-like protein n=1 Tax=Actinoallomurus sp. NPDC050550 TaxID=3154937 RepID=UPI0033E3C767